METHASHHRELDAVVKVSRFFPRMPHASRNGAGQLAAGARFDLSTFLRGDARHG